VLASRFILFLAMALVYVRQCWGAGLRVYFSLSHALPARSSIWKAECMKAERNKFIP
jgi:hypothetical protein